MNLYRSILCAAAVLAAGCSPALVPIRDDAAVQRLRQTEPPIPYRITLAPVAPAYDREGYNTTLSAAEYAWVPECDFAAETEDLAGLLRDFSLFSRVTVHPGPDESPAAVMAGAFANRDDFVLRLDLAEYRVAFDRVTKGYVPNIILWFILTPPTWWVADEVFHSAVSFDLKLIDVYSGEVLFKQTYRGVEQRALDDFQRGWNLFGIFKVPEYLKPSNWEKINRRLTPFALKAAKTAVITAAAEGDLRAFTASDEFRERAAKKVAVAVGVSRFNDRRIPALRYAAGDAARVQEMLTDTRHGTGINPAFCRLLQDQQASRRDIMDLVEEYGVNRCRAGDTFIFYYAGYGCVLADPATGAPRGYLVPADCDMGRVAETALGLDQLRDVFTRINAKSIILVLDCGFSAGAAGRTLPVAGPAAADLAFCDGLTADPRVRVVLAAGPGQNAYEFESLQSGLFTYYLCTGVLEGEADANIDGRVMLEEVYQYARNNIFEISAYKGARQEPRTLGAGDFGLVLYAPRAAAYGIGPDTLAPVPAEAPPATAPVEEPAPPAGDPGTVDREFME
ncbi:MAG: caspase family protein [Planctomycetota bacterium]